MENGVIRMKIRKQKIRQQKPEEMQENRQLKVEKKETIDIAAIKWKSFDKLNVIFRHKITTFWCSLYFKQGKLYK
mgnify:CR=1 FL=1